jgi:hypothetical protein
MPSLMAIPPLFLWSKNRGFICCATLCFYDSVVGVAGLWRLILTACIVPSLSSRLRASGKGLSSGSGMKEKLSKIQKNDLGKKN